MKPKFIAQDLSTERWYNVITIYGLSRGTHRVVVDLDGNNSKVLTAGEFILKQIPENSDIDGG
jgi:hypothetical protein